MRAIISRRKRGLLHRTRAREVTRDERRSLGLALDFPAVGLEIVTCEETFSIAAPAGYHVDRAAIERPVAVLGTGFRHRASEARRYMGAVVALASLPDETVAEIAVALTGRVASCEKAHAGLCSCGARHAPAAFLLAASAGVCWNAAMESMGRAAGLTPQIRSAAASEELDHVKSAVGLIIAARKPIQRVIRASAPAGACTTKGVAA